MAAPSGGCHDVGHWAADVGAPTSPALLTPWTLNLSESPSRPRSSPALTVTLVCEPRTSTLGAWPMKPVPHDEPITVQDAAGTRHFGPAQAVQDTTQPPSPLATALTDAGAPGPTAVVVKLTGTDDVDSRLMYAVTTAS